MSFGISSAVIGAVAGPVIGGLLGSDAAGDAADAQSQSAARTDATNRYVFDKQVELQEPFRQGGVRANNKLLYLLGLDDGSSGGSAAPTYAQLRAELAPKYTSQSQTTTYNNDRSPFNRIAIADDSGGYIDGQGGPQIDEAGLNAAIQQRMSQYQAPVQADPNDPAYGSLMRDFSMADFEADPGYKFRMDEGTKAVEGGAAARGGLLSGAAQKALQKYGQESASQEYGNAFNRFTGQQTNHFNRLKSMVDTGTGASTQIGNAAQTFGNATAQTNSALGNAQAAGAIGQANAWSNSVGQVSNNLMQLIQKPGSNMRPPSSEAYYGY